MHKAKRWRYYCDYCKKSGGSASAMTTHEKHCTMNPDRDCRLCERIGETQPLMADLIAVLPYLPHFKGEKPDGGIFYDSNLQEKVNLSIRKIREITDCPMCIFSALRQTKLLEFTNKNGFDFKEELEQFWQDRNDEDREETEQSALYG